MNAVHCMDVPIEVVGSLEAGQVADSADVTHIDPRTNAFYVEGDAAAHGVGDSNKALPNESSRPKSDHSITLDHAAANSGCAETTTNGHHDHRRMEANGASPPESPPQRRPTSVRLTRYITCHDVCVCVC
jgi:hypothetical protein